MRAAPNASSKTIFFSMWSPPGAGGPAGIDRHRVAIYGPWRPYGGWRIGGACRPTRCHCRRLAFGRGACTPRTRPVVMRPRCATLAIRSGRMVATSTMPSMHVPTRS
jgi:hypothetical protein